MFFRYLWKQVRLIADDGGEENSFFLGMKVRGAK